MGGIGGDGGADGGDPQQASGVRQGPSAWLSRRLLARSPALLAAEGLVEHHHGRSLVRALRAVADRASAAMGSSGHGPDQGVRDPTRTARAIMSPWVSRTTTGTVRQAPGDGKRTLRPSGMGGLQT